VRSYRPTVLYVYTVDEEDEDEAVSEVADAEKRRDVGLPPSDMVPDKHSSGSRFWKGLHGR